MCPKRESLQFVGNGSQSMDNESSYNGLTKYITCRIWQITVNYITVLSNSVKALQPQPTFHTKQHSTRQTQTQGLKTPVGQ